MKTNLYIFTLEKIEQRYTKQWYNTWKKEFSKWFDVKYIDGIHTTDKIEKGKFLDINKTNIWKAEQVIKIANLFKEDKIKKGDKFFFTDGWHFGITALKYMAQLNNIKIKIYCYWHSGTWDEYDFITQAGLGKWAGWNEAGWFRACDKHFVATKYHKKIIIDYFGERIRKNIYVVGFPMNWEKEIKKEIGIKSAKKKNLIVFPHRLDPEKQPKVFDEIIKRSKCKCDFVKTLEVTKTKKEYYNLISKAKIVFSANLQETFGIGTVEALMLGAIPIVPNRLSYLELYPQQFRYQNIEDAMTKINHYVKNYDNILIQKTIKKTAEKILKQSNDSIKKMARVMM